MRMNFMRRPGLPKARAGILPIFDPAPTGISGSLSIAYNAAENTSAGTVTLIDPGGSGATGWTITGPDATKFKVSSTTGSSIQILRTASGTLVAGVSANISVHCTDNGGNTISPVAKPVTIIDPAAVTLLETVTLDNFSGGARTNPYFSFRRFFAKGAVPTGSKVDLRYSGVTLASQQADGITLHNDGSLRAATFSGVLPVGAMADNANAQLALMSQLGSFDNTTTILRSAITGRDFTMRVKAGGTDYFCKLNHLDALGQWRQLRAGSTVRAWKHWGVFRAGTGSSDTDHGTLNGRFYTYAYADGRYRVWGEWTVGRVAQARDLEVTEIELLDGATSLYLTTTPFTAYGHCTYPMAAADGNALWSASPTELHARVSPIYFHDKKILWNIKAGPTQIAAIGAGTALNHAPNALTGGWAGSINQGGGNHWIGPMMNSAVLALLTNDKTRVRNDRVMALVQGWLFPGGYYDAATGYLPPINNTNYTGLAPKQPNVSWQVARTIAVDRNVTDTGDSGYGPNGWAATDTSHGPAYSYFQAVTTGDEWWQDRMVELVGGSLGSCNPGTSDYSRNPILGGIQYFGAAMVMGNQMRQGGWALRDMDNCVWTLPDDNPNAPYMRDLHTTTLAAQAKCFELRPSSYATLGIWPGLLYGNVSDWAQAPWQHGYTGLTTLQALNRETISSSHPVFDSLSKWYMGGAAACPYHAMGALVICFRQGANPTAAGAIATDWSQVYYGHVDVNQQTEKLISDAGGDGGSCPISGQSSVTNEPYGAGHSYPSILHATASIAALMGIPNASAVLAKMNAHEATLGFSGDTTAWNARPVWRMRDPAA